MKLDFEPYQPFTEYRNAGIGSSTLNDIRAEGTRPGKRVSIHVEMFNPALALYQRLGFRKRGSTAFTPSWSGRRGPRPKLSLGLSTRRRREARSLSTGRHMTARETLAEARRMEG